jgi:hypothetical protein
MPRVVTKGDSPSTAMQTPVFVGCRKPAEPCRAKRCTDLALFDAVNGNAEHIGADLQRRMATAAMTTRISPSPLVHEEIGDTDEGQPMAIWDSINQVYFEGRDSAAGCSGWENGLAYLASCRSPSEYREDCPCKP